MNRQVRPETFNLQKLVRPNIRELTPYRSARDDYDSGMLLDANENSYGSPFGQDDDLNRYPHPYQHELRNRIADYRSVEPDNVFVGVGSDEAIDLLYRIFCEPSEDNVIVTPPTYGMYKVSANIHNTKVKEVLLSSDFMLRSGAVLEEADDRTKLIFLCSPNNPTGNHLKLFEIERILKHFPGVVVVDEAYVDFGERKSLAAHTEKYPNLVVLQTFSKAFGLAGIRLGTAIASSEIIELLMKVKAPYNINRLTADYALRAFDHLDRVQSNIEEIRRERARVFSQLREIDDVEKIAPSDANFLLFQINHAYSVYRSLAKDGVIIRYRGDQPHCENGLRVTIGTPEQNDQFLNSLKKVTKELH